MRPLLLPALLLLAATAHGDPIIRYTWGDATADVVDQPWAGPATYAQTLSITGLGGTVSALDLTLVDGPVGVPAWQALCPASPVPAPTPDCLGAPGFEVDAAVTGAIPIPGTTVSALLATEPASLTNPVPVSLIRIHVAIAPPLVADPATRYAIATLSFHHQDSVAGGTGPGCRGADQPRCFALLSTSAIVGGVYQVLSHENDALSWQGSLIGMTQCLRLATPARGSTWGTLKTRYR